MGEFMAKKHYDYSNGPPTLEPHSKAKHDVYRAYLKRYFQKATLTPQQDRLKLTIVEGFAGCGSYLIDGQEVSGSPLICLEAAREAEFEVNRDRAKPVRFDVEFIFVEKNKDAFAMLENKIRDRGFATEIGKSIHLRCAEFESVCNDIVSHISGKSRTGRSIFILDQYGYGKVPFQQMRGVFNVLHKAEIILTFGIDSLINYLSDSEASTQILNRLELPEIFKGRSIEDIKSSEPEWRFFMQSQLYRGLAERSGAAHDTPFFIRNTQGHGDYWLIHLSQHATARNEMTEVHWSLHNHFVHYGKPGLDMFQMSGFDHRSGGARSSQCELFAFDSGARELSISALMEDIAKRIYANQEGILFDTLFTNTCNGTPATKDIYKDALQRLAIGHREIEIVGQDGKRRRSANTIQAADVLRMTGQTDFFIVR
jgi:three-Cys-motif partner protein